MTTGIVRVILICAIAFVPGFSQRPSTVYAGTDRGLYWSADGGQTWENNRSLGPRDVIAVGVYAGTPATLFAATPEGLYRSMDGGSTWEMTLLPAGARPRVIVTHPETHGRVYAAGNGLWISSDMGLEWREVQDFAAPPTDLVIDVRRPLRLYTATTAGIYRTEDGGKQWRLLAQSPPCRRLAIDVTDSDRVYAGIGGAGLYSTRDAGARWEQMRIDVMEVAGWLGAWGGLNVSVSTNTVDGLLVDPRTGELGEVAFSGCMHWDGSLSEIGCTRGLLKRVPGGWTVSSFVDTEAMAVDPASSAVYAGGSEGFYYSQDGGNWMPARTFAGLRVHGLAIDWYPAAAAASGEHVISTVAGRDPVFEGAGGPGPEAKLGLPRGIALDGKGNVFFADSGFSAVMKVDADGRLEVLADSTKVWKPKGIAIDSAGNLYVADNPLRAEPEASRATVGAPSGRVVKITQDGKVSTIAGSGSDADGEGIPAVQARLTDATGLAIDGDGNVYVAETFRNRVRRIDRNGNIFTIAGNGQNSFGPPSDDVGDGGPATLATLRAPLDLSMDKDGDLLIADWQNYRIRRVDRQGTIRTVAGGGRGPLDEGVATEMRLDGPCGVVAAPDGGFYLFDWHVITRVTPDGIATRVTNWSGGPEVGDGRLASEVYVPGSIELSGLAADAEGNLYLADVRNSRVRRIGPDGIVTTVAGSSPFRFAGDGGPAVEALLNAPVSVAASPDGSVHILERDNCRVRSIGPDGTIRTLAGNGICISGIDPRTSDQNETAAQIGLGGATAIAADQTGNVYLADGPRIRVITPDGQIRSVVNRNGQPGAFGDVSGPAVDARISGPVFGLYVDRARNIYFADMPSNRVRKVSPEGIISTFAGSGSAPGSPVFAGDGGPAIEARMSRPTAITGDPEGNIYILDLGNRRIRKVSTDGVITTVAGSGPFGYSGDSGPALEAAFSPAGPFGYAAIAADGGGNLYIADQGNHRIRRITPDGIITTIAGTGQAGFEGDGEAGGVKLNSPTGLAVDSAGNVYVADSGNHRIRKISGR